MSVRLATNLTREISRKLNSKINTLCTATGRNTTTTGNTPSTFLVNHRTLATFRPSSPLSDKITVQVPTMGDSITEGTIVEWAAGVGEAVKEGDVIVLVETDKVTIDIKADMNGVITDQYGAIDDTIEVGADLYQIDTEGTATVTSSTSESENSETSTVNVPSPPAAAAVTKDNDHGRVPSIRFLGKDGWKQKLSIVGESTTQITPEASPIKPHGSVILDGGVIPPTYGRLPFSEREMEALIMGGASEAPLYDGN